LVSHAEKLFPAVVDKPIVSSLVPILARVMSAVWQLLSVIINYYLGKNEQHPTADGGSISGAELVYI
jgi:hypothetical protein